MRFNKGVKRFIALSVAAAATMAQANTENMDVEKEIKKLQKQVSSLKKQLIKVKKHDAGDNIKWNIDFRTAHDNIDYETAKGKDYGSSDLLTSRLWLGMAFNPTDNVVFKGTLSYQKAFGANPPRGGQAQGGFPQRGFGFDTFDWVVNESVTDNTLKVKEAYWLYFGDDFLGSGINWTASVGRRPSTGGFLTHLRNDDAYKSPLGHVIDVEFDGASFKFDFEDVVGLPGADFKICLGRGLTNSRARFNQDGGLESYGDYSSSSTELENIDMYGFIITPYNDGQYHLKAKWYKGINVPGFTMAEGTVNNDFTLSNNTGMVAGLSPQWSSTGTFQGVQATSMNQGLTMKTVGDQEGAALSLLVDGIGDGINDFLDDTKFFVSYAMSKSHPDNDYKVLDLTAFDGFKGLNQAQIAGALGSFGIDVSQDLNGDGVAGNPDGSDFAAGMAMAANGNPLVSAGMLGSTESETGTSIWIGAQFPAVFTEDGRIGIEYNKGSKYWRPFTYGEDTIAASKLAARGTATEIYYTQPLVGNILTAQVRYTSIDYEYTGSQGFFGADGTPMTMDEAVAYGMDPVDKATDIRLSIRYRY